MDTKKHHVPLPVSYIIEDPMMKSPVVKITLVFLLIIAVAEGTCRLTYKKSWHEQLLEDASEQQAKNLSRKERKELFLPKSKGERRIMILGDSFTYGFGVEESKIFSTLLEKSLNSSKPIPGVDRFSVMNGGIPGSLTDEWVQLWTNVHRRFDPDVLLIVFFLRDGTLEGSIPHFFVKIRREIVKINKASVLYQKSYLYRTLKDQYDRLVIGYRYVENFKKSYFGTPDQTAQWKKAQEDVRRLNESAQKLNVAVGFVVFPILVDLNEKYPFEDICNLLMDFAKSSGIRSHNLLSVFRFQNGPDLWNSGFDQHPNAKGHELAFQSLLPFVTELLVSHESSRNKRSATRPDDAP